MKEVKSSRKEKIKFWILVFSFTFFALHFTLSFAQPSDKLVALTKQVMEAKDRQDLYSAFEDLTDLYFNENKYNEYVDFLNSLINQKKELDSVASYYIALTRYYQLKYLEKTQNWDEYFNQGNTYRDQITQNAQKTISSPLSEGMLGVYARLVLWKFHKDQQDTFSDSALSELISVTLAYANNATNLVPIKDVASQLMEYQEKVKARELYKVYINKLILSDITDDQLRQVALDFYNEANLELAEGLYDVYIDRIMKVTPKEKYVPILIDIAKSFSYKDTGPKDPLYAEKIFKKIEEMAGKEALGEELVYLRAFNSEKIKDYPLAKDGYSDLIQRYPQSVHADEADFKLGIIHTYILSDIKTGRFYFEKLSQKETLSPQVISSIYQLGLLSQWQGDLVKAKGYYDNLLQKAKESFEETVALTKQRLKEIEETKPIEYNLKTFLDVSLNQDHPAIDISKLDLNSNPYITQKEKEVMVTSCPHTLESGCFQVELQYLWSGHLGTKVPSLTESTFNTDYKNSGTKELNLVVVSPSGIIGRSIDMVDIAN